MCVLDPGSPLRCGRDDKSEIVMRVAFNSRITMRHPTLTCTASHAVIPAKSPPWDLSKAECGAKQNLGRVPAFAGMTKVKSPTLHLFNVMAGLDPAIQGPSPDISTPSLRMTRARTSALMPHPAS